MGSVFHFSEDPGIEIFSPQPLASDPKSEPLVWAIDDEHRFLYCFPRDCPRVAGWVLPETTAEDALRFFADTTARRIMAIESSWLERLGSTKLYAYTLPSETFEGLDDIGMHVSRSSVAPASVEPVGDLLTALLAEDVELRITPSLWPLADALVASTLHFSLIRMRNAMPRP